ILSMPWHSERPQRPSQELRMTFDEVSARVLDLLQRQGRVSYRALKRRFDLDDDYLEDLKAEIIKAHQLARDEAGEVLVWTGGAGQPQTPARYPERPPMDYTSGYHTCQN